MRVPDPSPKLRTLLIWAIPLGLASWLTLLMIGYLLLVLAQYVLS